MDFFALHSVMNAKNMVTTHRLDANRLWATRMAYGTKNWCSIEMTWQRSHLAQPRTSLCFPYLLIECTAYFFFSCSKSLPAFFFFFPFPFRFSLSSLHPEFLSPLRAISHFVSFLVSLCGPYCSVSGMKSLSLPSVLCISAQVPGCITLTSPPLSSLGGQTWLIDLSPSAEDVQVFFPHQSWHWLLRIHAEDSHPNLASWKIGLHLKVKKIAAFESVMSWMRLLKALPRCGKRKFCI